MKLYKTREGAARYTRPGHRVEQVTGGFTIKKIPIAEQRERAARLQERLDAAKAKEQEARTDFYEFERQFPDKRQMSPNDHQKWRRLNQRYADFQRERKELEHPVRRF